MEIIYAFHSNVSAKEKANREIIKPCLRERFFMQHCARIICSAILWNNQSGGWGVCVFFPSYPGLTVSRDEWIHPAKAAVYWEGLKTNWRRGLCLLPINKKKIDFSSSLRRLMQPWKWNRHQIKLHFATRRKKKKLIERIERVIGNRLPPHYCHRL